MLSLNRPSMHSCVARSRYAASAGPRVCSIRRTPLINSAAQTGRVATTARATNSTASPAGTKAPTASTAAAAAAAAETDVGPICQKMLDLPKNTSWQQLVELVTPSAEESQQHDLVLEAVKAWLAGDDSVEGVQLVGPTASGTSLPGDVPIVAVVKRYSDQNQYQQLLKDLGTRHGGQGHNRNFGGGGYVQRNGFHDNKQNYIACTYFNNSSRPVPLRVHVAHPDPPTVQDLLKPDLKSAQRCTLSAALLPLRTQLQQQQPELYKLAVRVVVYWAWNVHTEANVYGLTPYHTRQYGRGHAVFSESRDADFLQEFSSSVSWARPPLASPQPFLELLVLEAFQQYQQSAARRAVNTTTITSSSSDTVSVGSRTTSVQDADAAALDSILLSFLKLSAALSPKTFISWNHLHSQDSKHCWEQVLNSRGDVFKYPLPVVLDLANPTFNTAESLLGWQGSTEKFDKFVKAAQAYLDAVVPATFWDLELQVQQQEVMLQQLQSKLDNQSRLLQELLAVKRAHE